MTGVSNTIPLDKPLMPTTTRIGVLGGGQLGRMLVYAARRMAYQTVVFDPSVNSPAGLIADQHIQADYTDHKALADFVAQCDAVTTEFENIPISAYAYIQQNVPVSPAAHALQIAQDRALEKQFLSDIGVAVVPYKSVSACDDMNTVFSDMTFPALVKTARFGYDGKGQVQVASAQQAVAAVGAMDHLPKSHASANVPSCVVEQLIDLHAELSVVLARSASGATGVYPVADNIHRNGILHTSCVPSRLPPQICKQASEIAKFIAQKLDYCGVLAVEFFLSTAGDLYVNELAPRPHNSGHYTIDACVTSQFEQQVRMMCGMTAGDTRLLTPVVMVNLLGDLWQRGEPDWHVLLSQPNVKLHLYGKGKASKGRKMGHFCVLDDDIETAHRFALELHAQLQPD